MAVPTGYTFETFAQFVYNEVLLYVADTMLWFVAKPLVEGAPPVYETLTLSSAWPENAGIAEFTVSKPINFNVGTEIVFTGDATVYTAVEIGQGVNYNGSLLRVKFFPYNQSAKAAAVVGTYEVTEAAINSIVTDPTYGYILDETLISMNLTDVSQINSSNIKEFKLRARMEAWRAVLGNCVSMTNADDQEGFNYNRGQVFAAAQQQLQLAESEFYNEFGNTGFSSSGGGHVTSSVTTVKGAW